MLVVENDHASAVADAPLHTLTTGGLARWAHVRTVSKFLGTDLRWAAAAVRPDDAGPARRAAAADLGLGQSSAPGDGARADDGRRHARVGGARRRRRTRCGGTRCSREFAAAASPAHGVSGMNVWVPVRDESAVVNGLRSYGWWVAAGARFRLASGTGVRISVADLAAADAARLASDFAAVLGESEATYGG